MNPYADECVRGYVRAFLDAYFADNRKRLLVFGINPGRFGAGVTGVSFTDPVALADECGIQNNLKRRKELSSIFIHELIERYGGPRTFYGRFFLTAVCPLGFTRKGKNRNYFDDRALELAVTPFIRKTIDQQIAFGARPGRAIVLGVSKNFEFMQRLNDTYGFFRELRALEHPRWIMQYRRRELEKYLDKYEEALA